MEENKLKKALTPAGIWAVAVGAVAVWELLRMELHILRDEFHRRSHRNGNRLPVLHTVCFYVCRARNRHTQFGRTRSIYRKGVRPRPRLFCRLQLSRRISVLYSRHLYRSRCLCPHHVSCNPHGCGISRHLPHLPVRQLPRH